MGRSKPDALNTADVDEAILYQVLDAIPEAALVADDDGCYVYANAAALELTGRTMAQLRRLTIAQLAAPGQQFEPLWKEFHEAGTLQGDFEFLVPEGATATVEFNARTNILPGRHLSFLRDVTAARRLEQRLRKDEAKFVMAFMQSPVAMTIRVLGTGVFVEANETFLELTGRWRSEVVGRTGDDIGLWEDSQPSTDLLARLHHGVPSGETVATLIRRNGETRKLVLSARRVEIQAEPHAVMAYVPL